MILNEPPDHDRLRGVRACRDERESYPHAVESNPRGMTACTGQKNDSQDRQSCSGKPDAPQRFPEKKKRQKPRKYGSGANRNNCRHHHSCSLNRGEKCELEDNHEEAAHQDQGR